MKLFYPSPERIIANNVLALNLIKVKKADKAEVLNKQKIVECIENCKKSKENVYGKAALLMECQRQT